MLVSLQPFIDQTTSRRRLFEAYSPSTDSRLFIKRSATLAEATKDLNRAGSPANRVQRSFSSLKNEAYAISYIKKHTSIPVPNLFTAFEDRDCFYLVQEYAENAISALHADNHLHAYISKQLERYVEELHSITNHKLRSFTEEIHFPARMVSTKTYLSSLEYPEDAEKKRYVLCHGDLGWQNVMVDPNTGDIKAIIDWEYAGFYPVEVEGQFWKRYGTAGPNGGELSDADDVCALLYTLSMTKSFPTDYPSTTTKDRSPTQKKSPKPASKRNPSKPRNHKIRFKSFFSHLFTRSDDRSKSRKSPGVGKSEPEDKESYHTAPSPPQTPVEPSISRDMHPQTSAAHNASSRGNPPFLESSDVPEWRELNSIPSPNGGGVTSRTLAVQVAIASRENLVKQCQTLSRSFMVEHHATHDWLLAMTNDAPGYYAGGFKPKPLLHEAVHLVELCSLISKSLEDLSASLKGSGTPLSNFQDCQLLDLDLDSKQKQIIEEAGGEEERKNRDLEARSRTVKLGIHSDRDQAFRDNETLKWDAINHFAQDLLIVSHAAKSLLPYTPDRVRNQPSRHRDPKRKLAEDRARDLLLGGTGGLKVDVVDAEDWIPLDPGEHGVPEESEASEGEDVPQWALDHYYGQDGQSNAN